MTMVCLVRPVTPILFDRECIVPRALLPEDITDLILRRSPQLGKIRHLRIL